MRVYIRNFEFFYRFGKPYIKFLYYNGVKWKSLKAFAPFKNAGITEYTKFILDCVAVDLTKRMKDEISKKQVIVEFNSYISILEQLNSALFDGAAKLYR